jgi:ribosome maturation factor RimP
MAVEIAKVVADAVTGLGYELVDFERGARGMLRVFIDREGGISVDDCANVSNHLTRLFLVESIEYDRLEVSSPGLDRPLKVIGDFHRFSGQEVRVRLNTMVDNRKRFDAVIESVDGETITFRLLDDSVGAALGSAKPAKRVGGAKKKVADQAVAPRIVVPLADIERARLIPDI